MHRPSHPNKPIALVTGAAGIIGPAVVAEFSHQGWLVAASDRSREDLELCEHLSGKKLPAALFVPADLTTKPAADALVRTVQARLGNISAIVNAATVNSNRPLTEIQEKEAHQELAVNLLAPLWLALAALPALEENRGSIVNFSSVRVVSPRRNSFTYSCAKAAVEKATEIMAGALFDRGIRVNALRVGVVPGNHFLRRAARALPPAKAAQMAAAIQPEQFARARNAIGERSVGTPEDIARWAAILADPNNHFLNGETITLDGGLSRKLPAPGRPGGNDDLIENWLKNHHA